MQPRRPWPRKLAARALRPCHGLPLLLAVLVFCAGCSRTRHIPQGEYLLTKVQVHSDASDISQESLTEIVRQKPNGRVLIAPIYLYLYNWADPAKAVARKAVSDSLCAIRNAEDATKASARNERRALKGKAPKEFTPKECPRTRRIWWQNVVGEPPVVHDSSLTVRSTEQMRLFLQKEGYFYPEVNYRVTHKADQKVDAQGDTLLKRPKAEVLYTVKAGRPYTLCTSAWRVNDPRIDSLMQAHRNASLLRVGMRFDADVLDQERTRVTDLMRDNGYLFFNRDLVMFDADTTAGDHEVDLLMRLENHLGRADRGLRGTPEGTPFRIGTITVELEHRHGQRAAMPRDTLQHQDMELIYRGARPLYRPRAIRSQVLFRPGTPFNRNAGDRTYRRFNNLRVFDRVEILYDTTRSATPGTADVRISLVPSKVKSFNTEVFGTNRGGFFGTAINFGYRHKNLLRNMGSFTAQMTFGFEAQQGLTGNSPNEDATIDVRRVGLFNTLELGPEVNLRFPRFMLPVPRSFMDPDKWRRSWNQRTTITALYNYQQRPDYTRSLAKVGFGYEWNKARTRTWALFPVDVNFIRIPKISAAFANFINTSNDAILRDSYTDHVIAGSKLIYTWNTQSAGTRSRNMYFWRPVLQTSGHLLRLINGLGDNKPLHDEDGSPYYSLAGVRFAQFVKMEHDFRWYRTLHERSSLVFRAAAGVGVPFGNLSVLPFEASFFGGGANGMRAWRPRTLGPGSYAAPLVAFDRIGEVRIEGNAEYRFKLVGYVEGAFFADIGNIWMLDENPAKPGSGFRWDRFYSELAVGTGFGLRLNFDFFLVRFDLGLQTKDPALAPGERWLFESKGSYGLANPNADGTPGTYRARLNFNLGIGYPF